MKSEINDKTKKEKFDVKIKKLVHLYKDGDENVLSELMPLLIPLIYYFPHKYGFAESETLDRFYADVLNRITFILHSYKIQNAKFTTWFHTVLRNAFLNVQRKETSLLCMERVDDFQIETQNRLDNGNEIEIFNKLCSKLTKKEFHILKIRYPGLLHKEDLSTICNIFKQKKYRVYKMYHELKHKCRLVDNLNMKLENKIVYLLQAKKRIERYMYINKSEVQGNQLYKKRIKNIDATRMRMIKKLKRQTAVITFQEISYYLDIPLGSVSTTVFRAKKKIKKMGDFLNRKSNRIII